MKTVDESSSNCIDLIRTLNYLIKVLLDGRLTEILAGDLRQYLNQFVERVKLLEFVQKRRLMCVRYAQVEHILAFLQYPELGSELIIGADTKLKINKLRVERSWSKLMIFEKPFYELLHHTHSSNFLGLLVFEDKTFDCCRFYNHGEVDSHELICNKVSKATPFVIGLYSHYRSPEDLEVAFYPIVE